MDNSTLYHPVRAGRGGLPDQVAHQIIRLITDRQLEAGTRMPPLDELAGYLGVSRTAVREAIKLLDAWGMVAVKHGVGTFVATPTGNALTVPFRVSAERSEQSIRNLLQLREVLEPALAALAAQNASPEHVADLEAALRRMDEARAKPDEYSRADLDFHVTLAKATGNELFSLVIYPVVDIFQELIRVAGQVSGGVDRGLTFHRAILEQVKAKDAAKAKEAMQAHIRGVWLDVRSLLDKPAEGGA